jgi:hypothetical protein
MTTWPNRGNDLRRPEGGAWGRDEFSPSPCAARDAHSYVRGETRITPCTPCSRRKSMRRNGSGGMGSIPHPQQTPCDPLPSPLNLAGVLESATLGPPAPRSPSPPFHPAGRHADPATGPRPSPRRRRQPDSSLHPAPTSPRRPPGAGLEARGASGPSRAGEDGTGMAPLVDRGDPDPSRLAGPRPPSLVAGVADREPGPAGGRRSPRRGRPRGRPIRGIRSRSPSTSRRLDSGVGIGRRADIRGRSGSLESSLVPARAGTLDRSGPVKSPRVERLAPVREEQVRVINNPDGAWPERRSQPEYAVVEGRSPACAASTSPGPAAGCDDLRAGPRPKRRSLGDPRGRAAKLSGARGSRP